MLIDPYPNPESIVFIDIETQSCRDLRECGADIYIRHPSTRIMSLVAMCAERILIWVPISVCRYTMDRRTIAAKLTEKYGLNFDIDLIHSDTFPDDLIEAEQAGYTFVAHNAFGFDAPLLEVKYGFAPRWFDTIYPARAGGLPGDLNTISKIILGEGKDESGKAAMMQLTRVPVNRKTGVPDYQKVIGTAPLWESMIFYNVCDVIDMAMIYDKISIYGEPELMVLDQKINKRGIPIDRRIVEKLMLANLENERTAEDEIKSICGDTISTIRSVKQVHSWLESKGVRLTSLNKQAIQDFYSNPDAHYESIDIDESADERSAALAEVITLLQLRSEVTRTAKGKLNRIASLQNTDDGVIRDQLVYHGAHTGRWSGRALQPHNFPRGANINVSAFLHLIDSDRPLNFESIREIDKTNTIADILGTLTRCCIRAPKGYLLGIVDFSAIEARVVAYLAGQTDLIEIFADHTRDVYCEFGERALFGRPVPRKSDERQACKVAVLGCGYGMGEVKFGLTAKNIYRIDLASQGLTAKQCVDTYRSTYTAITGGLNGPRTRNGLWQKLQDIAFKVVSQSITKYIDMECGISMMMYDGNLMMRLPSGRHLCYRNATIEDIVPGYARFGFNVSARPTITFRNVRGAFRSALYGGLITENVVQAIARDILVDRMHALDDNGFDIPLHVHDEVLSIYPDDARNFSRLQSMAAIMSNRPCWWPEFPNAVEGHEYTHYVKSKIKGYQSVSAINGRIL